MRTRLCVLAALLACAAPRPRPPAGEVVLTVEGQVENAPFLFGRDDLPTLPRRGFEAASPLGSERATVRFEGIVLAALLADRMEVKREADIAVVHGAGGVVAAVPLVLLRQLKPVLADSVGGADPERWRRGAGPLQLAWPNLENPGIDTDPRMRWWWVGGVSKVELQAWRPTYGKALRVPTGASDAARLGADVLASECIGCHRVRGVGGTRGPELTGDQRWRAVTPSRLRPHLRDASGSRDAPEVSGEDAGRVAAFLEAVAVAGKDDDDLTLPRPPRVEEPPRR